MDDAPISRDEWEKLANESADRAEAASKLVEDRLGADYHDDDFATAKLTLWVYEQHQEIVALRAQVAEIERLTELLREAYPYLPLAVSLAEELAAMFPDIARPQDRTAPSAAAPEEEG